jgi:GH15 family glucan-1,4-alpha-glucosidase
MAVADTHSTSKPIEDYALIGDMRTAALVARDGSIDWLCVPCFDSPACFAALVGTPENGRWQISPVEPVERIERAYWPGTLVLQTEFETRTGRLRVIDCMIPASAQSRLLRIVQGVRGRVDVRMELVLRFDYGAIVPWVRRIDNGVSATAGPHSVAIRSSVPMRGVGYTTVSEFSVEPGASVTFQLAYFRSHDPLVELVDVISACDSAAAWWRDWCSRQRLDGRWRDVVQRSLITLKALTYSETGSMVAAPTTSLPECLGGVRNWDYRCCWLRDAAFTLYALLRSGYNEEASAWREWLLRAAAGRPQDLSIVFGLRGERRLTELELPWLQGYAGSRPVRTGNAACEQFQLDVYGELMDTLHLAQESGLASQDNAWALQRVLLDFLETAWHKPDQGIWEVRGPERHFTYSKVMAWTGFDRAIQAVERFGLEGPAELWRRRRDEIHDEVCRRAFDPQRKAFMQSYDSDLLDASVLVMPRVGFIPAQDPRMRSTVGAIRRSLDYHGFLLRYQTAEHIDGLPAGEGVFLPCSFWLCDNLALCGEHAAAVELFERLIGVCNDVGLLSEEYDPVSGRFLGNFPQAMSHVALVNTALNLATGEHPPTSRGA